MTEENIDQIRERKMREMLEQHHNKELPPQIMPWAFRHNQKTGYFEILQKENMVALTLDPKWATLVCDLLNSLTIAQGGMIDEQ